MELKVGEIKQVSFAALMMEHPEGAHLIGYVTESPNKVASALDAKKGREESDECKTAYEWCFLMGVGGGFNLPFTLYDWKATNLYDTHLPTPEALIVSDEPYKWYIGGTDGSEEHVDDFIREILNFIHKDSIPVSVQPQPTPKESNGWSVKGKGEYLVLNSDGDEIACTTDEDTALLLASAPRLKEQNQKMLAMLKRAPAGCYDDSPEFWGELDILIAEVEASQ